MARWYLAHRIMRAVALLGYFIILLTLALDPLNVLAPIVFAIGLFSVLWSDYFVNLAKEELILEKMEDQF